MPVLFLPPEFAYQSIPDPELSYTFLRRWHPVGVQTWFRSTYSYVGDNNIYIADNNTYVELTYTYVGENNSYVRLTYTYVGDNKSCVGVANLYVGDNIALPKA